MDQAMLKALAKELANRVNRILNIPVLSEAQEQLLFEMIIELILDLLLKTMGKSSLDKLVEKIETKGR